MNKEIKFSIHGELSMPIYTAIDIHPQRWNGWLRPIVTMEVAEQIAKDMLETHEDYDESPYRDVREAITEAKENREETVEVGCGFVWDLIEEQD
tara:strand:- start:465 stop:746 length:282 start_codon:yes stop_codon:yes gene_type:complete